MQVERREGRRQQVRVNNIRENMRQSDIKTQKKKMPPDVSVDDWHMCSRMRCYIDVMLQLTLRITSFFPQSKL